MRDHFWAKIIEIMGETRSAKLKKQKIGPMKL